MKISQKGFTAFKIIIVLFVILLGVAGYLTFIKQPAPAAPTQEGDAATWQTYSNSQYGFIFKYPSGWTVEESSAADATKTGLIVSLRSPETIQLLKEKNKIDPGYSWDFVVSFWSNINNDYALGGSWAGQRNYADLVDFLSDINAPFNKKVGDIVIAGQKAYEVSIGGEGMNYGVMVEYNGIYQLSFETAGDKSKLSFDQKQILSTFQFNAGADPFGAPPEVATPNCGPEDRYKFDTVINSKNDFVNFVKNNQINQWVGLDNFKDKSEGNVNWDKVSAAVKAEKIGDRTVYILDYNPETCGGFTLKMTNDGNVSVYGCCGK